jgi:hypothetical protein
MQVFLRNFKGSVVNPSRRAVLDQAAGKPDLHQGAGAENRPAKIKRPGICPDLVIYPWLRIGVISGVRECIYASSRSIAEISIPGVEISVGVIAQAPAERISA